MSLLIAIKHRDGIVLAADSRLTYRSGNIMSYTDNAHKIIPCGKNAIAFCGDAHISSTNQSVEGFLARFTKENQHLDVCDMASKLLHAFIQDNTTNCAFLIAGIREDIAYIYRLQTITNQLDLTWGSEDYGAVHTGHNNLVMEAFNNVPFNSMNFNTAIKLAESGINITTEAYKYKKEQCVGGPTEVYVIPMNGNPYWHKHKAIG